MAEKHRWTTKENEICSEEYVKCYIIGNSSMSKSEFVDNILRKLPELSSIPTSSLLMKVPNTRAIVQDLGLEKLDSYKESSLPHYAKTHLEQMKKVLEKYSLI